ncbi:hypothetical protein [Aquimarina algicola]|uniref:Lipoprotein n=1 Tax=Aquimarina algicola TaxID=2589995 RepID=A0A504JGE7_9FLAO|nr:hypothetical protein [Aquimarina algicola]TPN85859.1 hypothetical protein FHK87_11280 [Aquimarina algicola]
MKIFKFLLIISLLISCNSKPENTRNKKLQNPDIEQSSSNNNLIDSSKQDINEIAIEKEQLSGKIDSIIKTYNTSNISLTSNLLESIERIVYTDTINDQYWQRGTYYTSNKKNEKLYNVRVSNFDYKTRFYFIGINSAIVEGKSPIANIYELYNNEIHIIDSFNLPSPKVGFVNEATPEIHLTSFMLRQLDNLIIKNDTLYYFKENTPIDSDDSMYQLISKRDYYAYKIGSKKEAQIIEDKITSDKSFFCRSTFRALINPQNSVIAWTHNYSINFSHIPDFDKTLKKLYNSKSLNDSLYQLPKVEFDFSSFFNPMTEGVVTDIDNERDVFFGSMCWHKTDNKLYFDNSGFDYRCIWEADINNKRVVKIVPEHEAIQPFFINKKYITYVENNKIMVCEPTDKFYDKKLNKNTNAYNASSLIYKVKKTFDLSEENNVLRSLTNNWFNLKQTHPFDKDNWRDADFMDSFFSEDIIDVIVSELHKNDIYKKSRINLYLDALIKTYNTIDKAADYYLLEELYDLSENGYFNKEKEINELLDQLNSLDEDIYQTKFKDYVSGMNGYFNLYSFWARRHKENNIDVVYRILKNIQVGMNKYKN